MKHYDVFQCDNGNDYVSEGLYRIVDKRGRIGYADESGRTVIKPRFAFGFPFENGKAKVTDKGEMKEVPGSGGEYHYWESGEWYYIDKKGKKSEGKDNNNLYGKLENAARETDWHLWMTETIHALRHADVYRFGTWAELGRLSKNIPAMQWLVAGLDSFHINPSPVSPVEAALYILACCCPDNKVLGYVTDTLMLCYRTGDSKGMLMCARIHSVVNRKEEYPHLNGLYNILAGFHLKI